MSRLDDIRALPESVRAAIKVQQATSTGFRHEMADIGAQFGTPEQKLAMAEALKTGIAAEAEWWTPFVAIADATEWLIGEVERLTAELSKSVPINEANRVLAEERADIRGKVARLTAENERLREAIETLIEASLSGPHWFALQDARAVARAAVVASDVTGEHKK